MAGVNRGAGCLALLQKARPVWGDRALETSLELRRYLHTHTIGCRDAQLNGKAHCEMVHTVLQMNGSVSDH